MVKDQEYLEKKASYCLDLAKKLGATGVEVNVGSSISETVNFRNKKLDESNRSDNLGVDITTYIGKKKSSISSSNLLQDNLNILIEKCIETTKNTPEDEFNSLPDKDLLANEVKELNLYDDTHIENDDKIKYLSRLENSASSDKKIVILKENNLLDFFLFPKDYFFRHLLSRSRTEHWFLIRYELGSIRFEVPFQSWYFLQQTKTINSGPV